MTNTRSPWEILSNNGVAFVVAFVVVTALGWVAAEWYTSAPVGPSRESDSTGRVRVGMHVSRLAGLPGTIPGDPTLAPGSSASGSLVSDGGGRVLRVRFRGGRVTSVQEGTSNSGDTATFKMIADD